MITHTGITFQSTALEIFEVVRAHLLKQGRKSLEPVVEDVSPRNLACLYRGDGGCACAIGALILDEFYKPGIEGIVLHLDVEEDTLIEERPLVDALVSSGVDVDKHRHLLIKLQKVHDESWPHVWPRELERIRQEIA